MAKSAEDNFRDWENSVFGFGYGDGEAHILPALRDFMASIDGGNSYDYKKLEAAVTPPVAWLLINALCKCDAIEYGTSPRFGWLTKEGEALREFLLSRTADDLVSLCMERSDDYVECYPDACNCGPDGFENGAICKNPFWRGR